jgi:alpha-tubulin suppressor-like RCC1 family protein
MRGRRLEKLCVVVTLLVATALLVLPGAASANTVLSWGEGNAGQLGIGAYELTRVPVGVCAIGTSGTCLHGPFLENVTQISASGTYGGASQAPGNSGYSLALLSNGTVAGWGENIAGGLGDGTTAVSQVPVLVCAVGTSGPCPSGPYLENVVQVSAGAETSLALLSNGNIVAWGDNLWDELGQGSNSGPETCGTHSCSLTPVLISTIKGVIQIAAGARFGLALLQDGTVMGWGLNYAGELGQGTWGNTVATPTSISGLTEVKEISAGAESMALLDNGQVRMWGSNIYGALGDGINNLGNGPELPEECAGEACSTHPVPVCAVGTSGACPSGPYLENVTAIAAGKNSDGGAEHSAALLKSGEVVNWGYNHWGQLGDATATGPETCSVNSEPCSATPVKVCAVGATSGCPGGPYLTEATAISAGGHHTVALLKDKQVGSWGEDGFGELGDGSATGPETCHAGFEECSKTPVPACAFRATSYCPTGPYLEKATEISAGTLSDLAVVEGVPVVPGPYWYKKNAQLPLGGPHVPVTTAGNLTLGNEEKVQSSCKVADKEEIWNPASGPGEDKITAATFKCKRTPSPCPPSQKLEVFAKGLPWASHLISASPVQDEISGVELELKCSGAFYDLYKGTLTPTMGNGVLEFGVGTLKDGNNHALVVTGTDKLKAPPGKVTAH